MARALGIDLGTTNSCVSVLEGGEPTVIANSEGSIGLAPRSPKNRSAVCRTPLASSALRGRSRGRLQVDVDAAGEGKHRRVPGQDAVHKPVGAARPPTEAAHKRSQPTTRLTNQPYGPQTNRRSPQADHTARLKMPPSTTVDDKRMAFKVTFSGDLQHSNNITL